MTPAPLTPTARATLLLGQAAARVREARVAWRAADDDPANTGALRAAYRACLLAQRVTAKAADAWRPIDAQRARTLETESSVLDTEAARILDLLAAT